MRDYKKTGKCWYCGPVNKQLSLGIKIGLLSQYFSSKPPKGLDPTFYHTGSYEGDTEQYEELIRLVDSVLTLK